MAVYDVSLVLGPETPRYPGDPPFECAFHQTIRGGGASNDSHLAMGSHAGTHLDAARHVVDGGRTVEQIAPDALVGPCVVVDAGAAEVLTRAVLETMDLTGHERVLFRTKNSAWIGRRFEPAYVAFSADGAQYLAELGPRLVGIDAPSLDRYEAAGYPAHHALLGSPRLEGAIEWLALGGVAAGAYDLFCGPLPVRGAEAAPCRVLLRQ